jgi:hypothetical protein
MTITITEAITTLSEAERRFHLSRTEDETLFSEWQMTLPDLLATETTALDELRHRELYSALQILKCIGRAIGDAKK